MTDLPTFDFTAFDRETINALESLAVYAAGQAKRERDVAEEHLRCVKRDHHRRYSGGRIADAQAEIKRHDHALKSAWRLRDAALRARMQLQGKPRQVAA